MLLEIIIIIISSLLFIKWYINRQKFFAHLSRFPGPPGLPFIGIMLELSNKDKTLPIVLEYLRIWGRNVVLYFGPIPLLVIGEPKLTEFVLASNQLLDKSDEYKFFSNWFGDGLLTSTGYKWRSHRKILTPSFHYKVLEEFSEVFDANSRILVKNINQEVGKDSFEVYQYITLCTLDIICETAMGTPVHAQLNPNSEYVQSIKNMCQVVYNRVFSLVLRIDFLYYLSPLYQIEKKAMKVLLDHSTAVIQKRRKTLLDNKNKNIEDLDEFGIKMKNTFLDVLLQSTIDGKSLTDEEIREEVDTFMFEGHDTTSVAISFALYCLSKHQDVQKKCLEELDTIFGKDKNAPCTFEDLQNMKYLELVIKETLRLYPSVGVIGRKIVEDIEYEGGILPKGVTLVLVPYCLHRNPDIYPDPEKFDPDRFTPENTKDRHAFAYIPFSAGPRNCIGQKFAMLELKSTISKMLRFYEILPAIPAHEVFIVSKVTLVSSTGIKIRLKERS